MGIAAYEFSEDMAFNYRCEKENEVYSCEPGGCVYGVEGFCQDYPVIVGKAKPEVITKRSKRLEDQAVRVQHIRFRALSGMRPAARPGSARSKRSSWDRW